MELLLLGIKVCFSRRRKGGKLGEVRVANESYRTELFQRYGSISQQQCCWD